MSHPFPAAALALTLAIGLGAGAAGAAPGPEAPRHEPAGERDATGDLRESLSLFYVHRARQEVGLSDEQALRILPIVEEVERSKQEADRRRRDLARRIELLSRDPSATDAQVAEVLRSLDALEASERDEQNRARDRMLETLTPQQKARFVMFAHRVRGVIERRLRQLAAGERPGGRHPPRMLDDEP